MLPSPSFPFTVFSGFHSLGPPRSSPCFSLTDSSFLSLALTASLLPLRLPPALPSLPSLPRFPSRPAASSLSHPLKFMFSRYFLCDLLVWVVQNIHLVIWDFVRFCAKPRNSRIFPCILVIFTSRNIYDGGGSFSDMGKISIGPRKGKRFGYL